MAATYVTKAELRTNLGIGYAVNAINGFRKTKINYGYADSSAEGFTFSGPAGSTPGVNYLLNKGAQAAAIATQANTYLLGLVADDGPALTIALPLLGGNNGRSLLNATQAGIQAQIGTIPMMVGGSMDKEFEIKDEAGGIPNSLQLALGWITSRQKIAEGAQKIIDVLYNFVKPSDFAYKYNSHADIFKFQPTTNGERYRDEILDQNYIGSSFQLFDGIYKINNLYRPKTVAISIKNEFNTPLITDRSRFVIGGEENNGRVTETDFYLKAPEVNRVSDVSMRYGALKFNFQNQYGQLEGVKQSVMRGCIYLTNASSDKFSTDEIFAGDTYVGRYTEKS